MKNLSITGLQEHISFDDMVRRTALVVTNTSTGDHMLLQVDEGIVMELIEFANGLENEASVAEEQKESVPFGADVSDEVEPGFQL